MGPGRLTTAGPLKLETAWLHYCHLMPGRQGQAGSDLRFEDWNLAVQLIQGVPKDRPPLQSS